MIRLCGAALGFFAFAVTIVIGILVDNPAEVTLLRAIRALVAFFGVGLVVGWIALRIVEEHAVRKARELFPEESKDSPPTSDSNTEGAAPVG